ncbi:T9SS type A sorting domain-containing protein [Saccharicrinis sp. 156]|uniref:T9SS type A sorting domain-containing protein n=1 Tax=Saccharicrinis sp. 156 TaxID=3417574 RepID=UPI003D349924
MNAKRSEILGILMLLVASFALNVDAQVSYGGSPIFMYTISEEVEQNLKAHRFVPSQLQLKSVDNYGKGQPLTFAHQYTVNYTPDNSGIWSILEDGTKVWRLSVSSPGAFSINLIFDRYKLPVGGKLFIYNTDFSHIIGSFTHKNNKPTGILATAPVRGDQVIVEYQEPKNAEFNADLLIGAVNHDFLGFYDLITLKTGYFGDAGYCNEDIACYDTDNQLDIRRSVVKMIVGGSELCTGTMINNTSNDGTPYMITAAHCMRLDNEGSTTLLFFNYESPHCATIEGSKSQTLGTDSWSITGGETKVLVNSLDIALLEMVENPPAYYRPYYSGWSLSSDPASPFKSIHHPQGDVKKIATYDGNLQPWTFNESGNDPYAQVDNFHWRVTEWTTGTTEVGSSGCPIFDGSNLLVGTLSGGEAYCGNPVNDYFTQFYKAWDRNTELDEHFKPWLDPENIGVQSLEGLDPYAENPFIRLSNVETGDDPLATRISEGGYLGGHNAKQTTVFAEEFAGIKSASIKGVYIMPCEYKYGSDQTVDIMVWEGSQMPQSIILKKEGVGIDTLREKREIFLEFDSPLEVNGSFFVGYEINYNGSPVDTMAVYHSANSTKVNNTMWVYHSSTGWEKASDVYDYGINYSLWLDVLAESVVYGDTQVVPVDNSDVVLFPIPSIGDYVYVNSNQQFVDYVEIIDMSGRIANTQLINTTGDKIPVSLNNLPTGVYILKLYLGNRQINKKFIVE